MCLIVFAWQPESPTVLRLAANRDEFYSRPSAALSEWPDAPGVFAGRDLQAGGTWLGVTAQGRFANRRVEITLSASDPEDAP